MRKRRFEILLPLRFNDGQPIDRELFDQTREELVAQFGSLTLHPSALQGIWVNEGIRYEDECRRFFVDVDDTPENESFFANFKLHLMDRFQQIAVYISSYPVDIV